MARRKDEKTNMDVPSAPPRRQSARLAASESVKPLLEPTPTRGNGLLRSSKNLHEARDKETIAPAPRKVGGELATDNPQPPSLVNQDSRYPTRRRSTRAAALSSTSNADGGSSSESSFLSNFEDRASSYETAGTSGIPTPSENLASKLQSAPDGQLETTGTRVNAAARAQALRRSKYSLNPSSKRSRDSDSEAELSDSIDARYAREVQRELNKMPATLVDPPIHSNMGLLSRRLKKTPRVEYEVEDSQDEDGDDAASALSTPVGGTPTFGTITGRAIKTRSSLPRRAARDNARKSINALAGESKKDTVIVDSEDGDGLSEGVFEGSDSDLDSDGYVDENHEEEAQPSNQASESLAVVIPHRNQRSAAANNGLEQRSSGSLAHQPVAQPVHQPPLRPRRGRRVARPRLFIRGVNRAAYRAEAERARLLEHHPEVDTMWTDLAAVPITPTAKAEQPASITRALKPFQLEGLHWMMQQEKTQWKGGLLGDEMGMGKTIQAVSLIMSDYPAKRPTLVLAPPVALVQWQNEIQDYTSGKLNVLVYHGNQARKLSVKEIEKHNVLITSYSTLEAMHRKQSKGWVRKDEDGERILVKEDSPLHAIKYHRVILDEAHSIKSRNSGTAKACFELQADYKWCLSGTPLQNRIGELFSLLRFLNIKPFACYMCKACSCSQVHWSVDNETRQCRSCNHQSVYHVSIFNLELLNPITNSGNEGLGKEAFTKLHSLLERIMLRRVKADHIGSMELPMKQVVVRNEFFGEVERDFATSIMTNTTRQFDTYVAQGVFLNNYANIFGLIMQMRQVADHPDMILRRHQEGGQNVLVCSICDDPAEDAIRSACHHEFCRACVKNYMRSFTNRELADCPRCHIPLAIDLEQEECEQDEEAVKKSSIINRIKMERWTSSTKIEMLIFELTTMRRSERTVKSIVFSQFTSMLQLVEWRLRRAGFNTVMLDGTMTVSQRARSIDHFMKNSSVEIFLVSLKAGGVALNLTEASRVFIVDPWWNPAAEWQSADRCHRIGQGRSCEITRLVIEDSVESRMVLLQEKKSNMIRGTINADEAAMQNLALEDLQFLFRGT